MHEASVILVPPPRGGTCVPCIGSRVLTTGLARESSFLTFFIKKTFKLNARNPTVFQVKCILCAFYHGKISHYEENII